jgi:hypothetical protein
MPPSPESGDASGFPAYEAASWFVYTAVLMNEVVKTEWVNSEYCFIPSLSAPHWLSELDT